MNTSIACTFTAATIQKPTIMKTKDKLRHFLLLAGSSLLAISSASAADGTWDENNNGNWTTVTCWVGNSAYASGADATATFGNYISADRIVNLDAPIIIGNITASDTTHNFTISGANILTLDRSDSIAPQIDVTTSGRTLTIGSQISGSDGLTKIGAGTLTLNNAANNYTGGTTISAGAISITADAHLGNSTGGLTFTGGALGTGTSSITSSRTITVNDSIVGTMGITSNGGTQNGGSFTHNGNLLGGLTSTFVYRSANDNRLTLNGTGGFSGTLVVQGFSGARDGIVLNNAAAIADTDAAIRVGVPGVTTSGNSGFNGSFRMGSGVGTSLTFNNRYIQIANNMSLVNDNSTSGRTLTFTKAFAVTATTASTLNLGGLTANGVNVLSGGGISNGVGGVVISLTVNANHQGLNQTSNWAIGGTNTYSGGTTVSAGTLKAISANALGSGNVTVSSGTLLIDAADAMADTASLYLPSASGKNITMNASDTVGKLFLAGVQQPNGIYTSSGSGSAWMNTGSGSLTVGPVSAQPVYWDLNGATAGAGGATPVGTWNASNAVWNNALGNGTAVAWTPGLTAAFAAGTAATGTYIVTVDGTQDISGLTFEEGTVTLSPGTDGALRLTADALVYVATASQTSTVATAISQDASARSLTKIGAGMLVLAGTNTFSSAIVNAGVLNISGNCTFSSATIGGGTLSLSGDNAMTGAVNLNAGTLALGSATALGTGTLFLNGGTIQSDSATARSFTNAVTIGGDFTVGGTGNLTFSNTGASALGATRQITVNTGRNATFAQAFSGSGAGITKAGAGTLTLTGNNTYTGVTTINAGTITLNNNGDVTSSAVSFTGSNTGLRITGGSGVTSIWNTNGGDFSTSDFNNIQVVIDGAGTAGSAVVTTGAGKLLWGRSATSSTILLTDGGQMNVNGEVQIGSSYYLNDGETGDANLTIGGGTATSTFTGNNQTFYIGYGDRNGANNNDVTVNSGGVLTGIGNMVVGHLNYAQDKDDARLNKLTVDGTGTASMAGVTVGYANVAGPDAAIANAVEVSNGGSLTTSGTIYIGRANVASSQANLNKVTLTGTGSRWNAGNQAVYVGYTGSVTPVPVSTGNVFTVSTGGVVTNINVLTVKAANTLSLGVGGAIYANTVTNSGTLAVALDVSQTPACGCLNVSSNLNVNTASLNINATGKPIGVFVIASYTTLTPPGLFAATNGLPDNCTLYMDYKGLKQIAIVGAAKGTLISFQ